MTRQPPIPRIVHVASGREWRGGQIQVALLARALASSPPGPIDQVVVTTRGSELWARLCDAGVPVRPTGWSLGADPRALLAVVSEARRTPSVLHAHDAHAALLASLAAPLSGSRYIATRRVSFPLKRPWPWKRADAVVAVAGAVKRVLIEDGLIEERIRVIPSGYDLEAARRIAPADLRARIGLPADALVAINVAALEHEKDHRTLVSAVAILAPRRPRLHLVIAGAGRLRGDIDRQVREAGLGGRVHLLGHVAEPGPLVAASSLFVLSSKSEGAGGAVFDALALGVPIATTAAGGVPEIVGEAALVVPPGDPDALAGAMRRVLDDDALRTTLVARGREQITRFDFRKTAALVLDLYRDLARSVAA